MNALEDLIRLGIFLRPSDPDQKRIQELCQIQGVYLSEAAGEPLDIILTKYLQPWLNPLWPKEWRMQSTSPSPTDVPIVLMPDISTLKVQSLKSNYQTLGFVSIVSNGSASGSKEDDKPSARPGAGLVPADRQLKESSFTNSVANTYSHQSQPFSEKTLSQSLNQPAPPQPQQNLHEPALFATSLAHISRASNPSVLDQSTDSNHTLSDQSTDRKSNTATLSHIPCPLCPFKCGGEAILEQHLHEHCLREYIC